MNTNFFKFSNRIGIFLAMLFAVCFVWYYIRPIEQDLHLKMFRLAYFGFEEMNLASFLAGAAQSYLWAYVGVGLWQLVSIATTKR
jgi:hypothetical protein